MKIPLKSILFLAAINFAWCAEVIHTNANPSGITNLTKPEQLISGNWTTNATAFWGDTSTKNTTKVGTIYEPGAPQQRFTFGVHNLGDVTAMPAALWQLAALTGYDPGAPYLTWTDGQISSSKQVSSTNNYDPANPHSALQASGIYWGAFINSIDWINNGQNMTIRYSYYFKDDTAPHPFASTYGSNAQLRIQTNLKIPMYTGLLSGDPKTGAIAWAPMNVGLKDTTTGNFIVFNCRLFDRRGFVTANGTHTIGGGFLNERVTQCGTGEILIATHLGAGTKYCTKDTGVDSQTTKWSNMKHFGCLVSRSQFVAAIQEANLLFVFTEPFSENPDDYILKTMDVGVEGSRMSATDPIQVGFSGSNLRVSTVY